MKVALAHRRRTVPASPSTSDSFARPKPRPLLRVIYVALMLLTSAFLSVDTPSPIALVSAASPSSFQRVAQPLGVGGLILTITCPSGTTCWVGGEDAKGAALLRSTNGGTSWHSITIPLASGGLIKTITCPSASTCLAGGMGISGGLLLRSTNGGTSWHSITIPPGLGLHRRNLGAIFTLACPSAKTCLAGSTGTKGAVLLRSTTSTSKLAVLSGAVASVVILAAIVVLRRRRTTKARLR